VAGAKAALGGRVDREPTSFPTEDPPGRFRWAAAARNKAPRTGLFPATAVHDPGRGGNDGTDQSSGGAPPTGAALAAAWCGSAEGRLRAGGPAREPKPTGPRRPNRTWRAADPKAGAGPSCAGTARRARTPVGQPGDRPGKSARSGRRAALDSWL